MSCRFTFPVVALVLFAGCQRAELPPESRVLIAATDLQEGTTLQPEHLEVLATRSPPQGAVEENRVLNLVGRQLRLDLLRGDALRADYLDSAPSLPPISSGRRTLTVPMRGAEQARVGERVDVVVSVQDPRANERVSWTLLQHMLVREVAHRSSRPTAEGELETDVTVEVPLRETAILAHAPRVGVLRLLQRAPGDEGIQEELGRTTAHTLVSGVRMQTLEELRLAAPTNQEGAR